jgi:hypothetical protein
LSQNLVVCSARENGFSKEEDVENEADREDITNWIGFCFHVFDVDDLWSNISWCTTSNK